MKHWTLLGIMCGAFALPQLTWARDPNTGYNDRMEGARWQFTLGGTGNSDRNLDSGAFGAGGSLGYYFNDNTEFVVRQDVNFLNSGPGNGSDTFASTRAALDYHFNAGRMSPFIGVNFGALYGDAVRDQFVAGPEAGVKLYLRPNTFVMLMGEYQVLFKNANRFDNNFDEGRWAYTLGMGFDW